VLPEGDDDRVKAALEHRDHLGIASDKIGVPTLSHGDMLEKVRVVRKKRIDAAVKAIR
jgi:hypothetical protein